MKKFGVFILSFSCLLTFCDTSPKKEAVSNSPAGYKLTAPEKVFVLPSELEEISGIVEIDSLTIACVQDERGTVYLYNLNTKKIINRIDFGPHGDYEGITRIDSTLYVLRSDGELSEIKNFKSKGFINSTIRTEIPLIDNEGICYDPANNRLLISPKQTPDGNKEDKDKRFIYGFSLSEMKLIPEPVLVIDLSAVDSFAMANNIIVPMKEKKKSKGKEVPDIKLRISDMAIHPVTGKLFALSSIDRLLFVFDLKNRIEYMEKLNPDLFKQPEGIAFSKNGVMYISNEGKNKSATLLRFNYQPAAVMLP